MRRTEFAIDQIERAELYVVQATELDLENAAHRLALEQLRAEMRAVRLLLRRPQAIM